MVKWFDPRSLSFPRQHRAELAAPEDVDVKVGHFLMTVLADVGEEAIAIICKPHHRGDLADPADELSDLPVRRLFGEVDPANIAAPGDHEHLDRHLRVYVGNGVVPVVLIELDRAPSRENVSPAVSIPLGTI